MKKKESRGRIYRCDICGAEVMVLAGTSGVFVPRCCNQEMAPLQALAVFYICPVCGAELAVLKPGSPGFRPMCCNRQMDRQAA
jgi:desulfoferrodoxin-like iron-binding protein